MDFLSKARSPPSAIDIESLSILLTTVGPMMDGITTGDITPLPSPDVRRSTIRRGVSGSNAPPTPNLSSFSSSQQQQTPAAVSLVGHHLVQAVQNSHKLLLSPSPLRTGTTGLLRQQSAPNLSHLISAATPNHQQVQGQSYQPTTPPRSFILSPNAAAFTPYASFPPPLSLANDAVASIIAATTPPLITPPSVLTTEPSITTTIPTPSSSNNVTSPSLSSTAATPVMTTFIPFLDVPVLSLNSTMTPHTFAQQSSSTPTSPTSGNHMNTRVVCYSSDSNTTIAPLTPPSGSISQPSLLTSTIATLLTTLDSATTSTTTPISISTSTSTSTTPTDTTTDQTSSVVMPTLPSRTNSVSGPHSESIAAGVAAAAAIMLQSASPHHPASSPSLFGQSSTPSFGSFSLSQPSSRPSSPSNIKTMDDMMTEVKSLMEMPNLAARLRFMLKDLLELRQRKWVTRTSVSQPKTLAEIRSPHATPHHHSSNHHGHGNSHSHSHHSHGHGHHSHTPVSHARASSRFGTGAGMPSSSTTPSAPSTAPTPRRGLQVGIFSPVSTKRGTATNITTPTASTVSSSQTGSSELQAVTPIRTRSEPFAFGGALSAPISIPFPVVAAGSTPPKKTAATPPPPTISTLTETGELAGDTGDHLHIIDDFHWPTSTFTPTPTSTSAFFSNTNPFTSKLSIDSSVNPFGSLAEVKMLPKTLLQRRHGHAAGILPTSTTLLKRTSSTPMAQSKGSHVMPSLGGNSNNILRAKAMTIMEMERSVSSIINELMSAQDVRDAVLNVHQLVHRINDQHNLSSPTTAASSGAGVGVGCSDDKDSVANMIMNPNGACPVSCVAPRVVYASISAALERKERERMLCSKFFNELFSAKLLVSSSFMVGISLIMKEMADIVMDAPLARTYVADIIGRAVGDEILTFAQACQSLTKTSSCHNNDDDNTDDIDNMASNNDAISMAIQALVGLRGYKNDPMLIHLYRGVSTVHDTDATTSIVTGATKGDSGDCAIMQMATEFGREHLNTALRKAVHTRMHIHIFLLLTISNDHHFRFFWLVIELGIVGLIINISCIALFE
jgi:hypothetical protein